MCTHYRALISSGSDTQHMDREKKVEDGMNEVTVDCTVCVADSKILIIPYKTVYILYWPLQHPDIELRSGCIICYSQCIYFNST